MEGKSDKISGSAISKTFSDYTRLEIEGSANSCKFVNCKYVTIKGSANACKFSNGALTEINGSANSCAFNQVEDVIVKGSMNSCTRDGKPFGKPAPPAAKTDRNDDQKEAVTPPAAKRYRWHDVYQDALLKRLRGEESDGQFAVILGKTLSFSGYGSYTLSPDMTVLQLKGRNLSINGVPVAPGTYKKGDNNSWAPVEASCIACGMERLALACSECQEPLYCSHECASDASWQEHILKSHPL